MSLSSSRSDGEDNKLGVSDERGRGREGGGGGGGGEREGVVWSISNDRK